MQIFEAQRDRLIVGAWVAATGLDDARRKAEEAAAASGGAAVFHVLRSATGAVLMTTMLSAFGDIPPGAAGD